jgi:hypothetical protein
LGQNITETLVLAAQLAPANFVPLAGGGEHQMDVFEYVHKVSFLANERAVKEFTPKAPCRV